MKYLLFLIILAGAVLFFKFGIRRITIMEYEKGLKYEKGRFKHLLGPGQYWFMPFTTIIRTVDMRPQFVSVAGQEVLSADGITLKVSLAANFEMADPEIAVNRIKNFQETLYLELQLALREIISATDIDTVLNNRNDLSGKLMDISGPKAEKIGINLIAVSVKDILFPGKLKEIFAQVVNARQEGLAALEKARGETAALRSLANAAKMLDDNPNLMQIRLVQMLGESSGNTINLDMPVPLVRDDKK